MTRAGHSTAALAVGFIGVCIDPTLHGLALAIGLVGGANLPDDLEFPLRSADGRGPTLVPHRSLTHWPWSYGAIAAAAWLL
ncbi:MAG TPA: hypothetical protein VNF68_02905, partial [Candidatus Baltobacteraceae bacterium]|nr:hypothetical protein [Candidatus Baltobacteraceae bacterium]